MPNSSEIGLSMRLASRNHYSIRAMRYTRMRVVDMERKNPNHFASMTHPLYLRALSKDL